MTQVLLGFLWLPIRKSLAQSAGMWTAHSGYLRDQAECLRSMLSEAYRARSRLGPLSIHEGCRDDESLDVAADHILILCKAGPQGGPAMPEWEILPIPKELVKQGMRDMLRLSDARMSGASYGACVLHTSLEADVGGPLALVKNGDMISVDVAGRTITLNVSDEELEFRDVAWISPEPRFERGYGCMLTRHIKQAREGCDFDFLETSFGAPSRPFTDIRRES